MPPAFGLGAVLSYNYLRHRQHRSTLCSTVRRVLPWPGVLVGWAVLTAVMLRHLRRGYL